MDEPVRSKTQAERWSRGLLRAENKHRNTAEITLRKISTLAAGSTVTLKDFGTGKDGNWFVESVIQHIVNERSTLTLRAPLEF